MTPAEDLVMVEFVAYREQDRRAQLSLADQSVVNRALCQGPFPVALLETWNSVMCIANYYITFANPRDDFSTCQIIIMTFDDLCGFSQWGVPLCNSTVN